MKSILISLITGSMLLVSSSAIANPLTTKTKKRAEESLADLSVWVAQLKKGELICRLGIEASYYDRANLVAPSAENLGLRIGDRPTSVNGVGWNSTREEHSVMRTHRPGDLLDVVVLRDDQQVTIQLPCLDRTEYARAVVNMFRAAKKGRWQECVDSSYIAQRAIGQPTPYLASHRLDCNEARRCGKKYGGCFPANSGDATFVYEATVELVNAARRAPDMLPPFRPEILNSVSWLEKSKFSRLAKDLNRQFLEVATAKAEGSRSRTDPLPSETEPRQQSVGSGTCFAVGESTVLTSHHVIDGASQLTVEFGAGNKTQAKVIQFSQATDLAILQINGTTPSSLSLAMPRTLSVGDQVFTIGFPHTSLLGSEPKYTDGTVSSLSGIQGDASYFQMSVPIQPGNSGGPVVNYEGEVVGVVASSAAVESFYQRTGVMPQNVNWASKSDYARLLFDPPEQRPIANSREEAIKMVSDALCRVIAVSN